MKTLAVLCNVVLAAITCAIVATEGLPAKPVFLAFTLLMMLVPAVAVAAIRWRPAAGRRSPGSVATLGIAAVGCLVLLGFVCWALVSQYPYPEGASMIPLGALALLTPALSLVVLRRAGLLATGTRP
jgi:hypothetical protein